MVVVLLCGTNVKLAFLVSLCVSSAQLLGFEGFWGLGGNICRVSGSWIWV